MNEQPDEQIYVKNDSSLFDLITRLTDELPPHKEIELKQAMPIQDDTADELIASHPAFQESIQRAREQKKAGQVKSLQALRQKYNAN